MKYPRTPHLPNSESIHKEDRIYKSDRIFKEEVVITEKRDGSNIMLSRANVYARSHSGAPKHPSFDMLKQKWACVRDLIPDNVLIFGEWLYAKHSIAYSDLEDYLEVFAILKDNVWLSFDDLTIFCNERSFIRVPLIFRGYANEKTLNMYCEGNENKEGIVIRVARAFRVDEFSNCVAKYVRPNHVQTDEHWTNQKIIVNGLINEYRN